MPCGARSYILQYAVVTGNEQSIKRNATLSRCTFAPANTARAYSSSCTGSSALVLIAGASGSDWGYAQPSPQGLFVDSDARVYVVERERDGVVQARLTQP